MNFPQFQEPPERVYASFAEIDSDPTYRPGTLENEQANANLLTDAPLFGANFGASIRQVQKEERARAQQPALRAGGLAPAPVTNAPVDPKLEGFVAQKEARALAGLGRKEGFWSNEQEVATSYRRQVARTKHGEKKYEAVLDEVWGQYKEKLLEMAPDEIADVIESKDGFEDETARDDFVKNATPFHERLGISTYHALRGRLSKRLPDYQLGQTTYMQVKSSSKEKPFRFGTDEAGRRQFRAYSDFYNTQIDEAIGSNGTDMAISVLDMLGHAVAAPFQTIDPDTIISPEWRNDPQKLARAMGAVSRLKDVSARVRSKSRQLGADAEKALRTAEDVTKFSELDTNDIIITDPDAPVMQAFGEEDALIKEIIELHKQGAFSERSRLSPVIGLVDSFLYGTTALAGIGIYSTDPGSVVNKAQAIPDYLRGMSSDDKELAEIARINEAITFQETIKDWSTNGVIFPMGDEWYASNPHMIKGIGEFVDPMMAVSFIKWAKHIKRAGMTTAAVETELLRNTNRLRRLSDSTLNIPPEIRLQIENVRQTLTAPTGPVDFAGKTLTDWDVLDIIARGKGMVTDIDALGNQVVRGVNAGEFTSIADRLDEFTNAQINSRARRQAGLARLAQRNQNTPFNQFGSYLARNFPVELRGITDTPIFKGMKAFFEKIRGKAQDFMPAGQAIIEQTPNKAIAFGAAKLAKGAAIASGVNFALSGGESANPFGGPGFYIASVYYLNDALSVAEFAGDKGKAIAEYLEAARNGRQINGSIAAYKVNEKSAEIRRLRLELTESLTEAERNTKLKSIDNLKNEISTWRSFQVLGWEKAALFLGKTGYETVQGAAALSVMMEGNDRASSGAFTLAGTMSLINAGWGSVYRNFGSGRIRKDQQRSVFAHTMMNMEPAQAQRMLDGYKLWKSKGFGDEFIAWANHSQMNVGNNQRVMYVTPSELHIASTTISAADILSGYDTDQYQYRLNLIKEFQSQHPGSSLKDAEAYAADKINQLVVAQSTHQTAVASEKKYRGLQHQTSVLAGRLDKQTEELQVAVDILEQDMTDLGLPTTVPGLPPPPGVPAPPGAGNTPGGWMIPTMFKPGDFATPEAFRNALKKQGINWEPMDLFRDPDMLKKWNQFRASYVEFAKLQSSYELGSITFSKLQLETETARVEAAKAADEAVNVGENRWRPGQSFVHTDWSTGIVGQGTVVANGVYIIDHARKENPDYDPTDPNSEQLTHSSVVMIDYTKFDPKTAHEEWGHKLFMAETFRDARTLLYRNAIGHWAYDENGQYVLKSRGDFWKTTTDQNGKEVHSFPELRAFAESYAAKLPQEVADAFMAEFDLSVDRFNENPAVNQAMMMPVFNELFANAYAQRMLQIDTSSSKIPTDPTSTKGGFEGSTMVPGQSEVAVSLAKTLYAKLFAGELTVSELGSVLKSIRNGSTADLTPEARGTLSRIVSERFRDIRNLGSILGKAKDQIKEIQDLKESGQISSEEARIKTEAVFVEIGFNELSFRLKSIQDFIGIDSANKFSIFWGKGGYLDNLIIKGAHERLLEQGLSPDIFGDGGWTSGVLYDNDGNPAQMPVGMSSLVDMIRYNTRTRVGTPDRTLMSDANFWNEDGTFSPEKAAGVDLVLWAAYNNKSHWLDPKSQSRMKPMQTIITEHNKRTDAFRRLITAEQAAGRSQGISVSQAEDGFSITGRFTKADVQRFEQILESSDFVPADRKMLMKVVNSLSEVHMQEVPAFIVEYRARQFATVNSPKIFTRPGGYKSTRGMVPISVFVRTTKEGADGKKLPDNREMDAIYIRSVDLDAFTRRNMLAWNGGLLGDNKLPIASKDEIRAIFNGDAKLYRDTVLDYLSMISSGGQITTSRSTTKYPAMRTVEMLREKILLDPQKYGLDATNASPEAVRAVAARMAEIVHGTIGAPNIAALMKKEKKAAKSIEEDGFDLEDGDGLDEVLEAQLNDNEKGRLRIFRGERSVEKPSWGMRDKNFLITDFRLDRMITMRETDKRIPWSPNSYFWNQTAYGAKSPNAWISVRNGAKPITGVGLHISDIVRKDEAEGRTLLDLGVSDVFEHGSGYKIVLAGSGMFRVYDNTGKYVGEERTIARAKDAAIKNGYTSPVSTRHEFDKIMVGLGFTPQGIQYIVPKGSFIRRSRYVSGDGKFMVRFDGENASIYELASRTAQTSGPRLIAKNIDVQRDGKGGYDLEELKAAVEYSADEMNQTTTLTYETVDELSGRATNVEVSRQDLRTVFENVDPDMLEFMPQMVGRSVQGQRVFAKNNPAYYAFKRRLIDYVGNYKKANQVINQMKKDLGPDVVESDPKAVAAWVEKYINDKQAELDLAAETSRKNKEDKDNARLQKSVLDPIAEAFLGVQQSRAQQGLSPDVVLSPADARARLLQQVGKFSQLAIQAQQTPLPGAPANVNFQTSEGAARNRMVQSLNNAADASAKARQDIGAVVNQLWINAAGYTLSLELLPDAPVVGGFSFSTTGLSRLVPRLPSEVSSPLAAANPGNERPTMGPGSGRTQYGYGNKAEPNVAKYRWVIYSPNGGIVGHYDDKEKAFKAMLERDASEKKKALDSRRDARGKR